MDHKVIDFLSPYGWPKESGQLKLALVNTLQAGFKKLSMLSQDNLSAITISATEYGLLKSTDSEIDASNKVALFIIAGGCILEEDSRRLGKKVQAIAADAVVDFIVFCDNNLVQYHKMTVQSELGFPWGIRISRAGPEGTNYSEAIDLDIIDERAEKVVYIKPRSIPRDTYYSEGPGRYSLRNVLYLIVATLAFLALMAAFSEMRQTYDNASVRYRYSLNKPAAVDPQPQTKSVFATAREWAPKPQNKIGRAVILPSTRHTETKPANSISQEPLSRPTNRPEGSYVTRHHSLTLNGTLLAIPIPAGYISDPEFPKVVSSPDPAVGNMRFHFMYIKNYSKVGVQDFLGLMTLDSYDSFYIGEAQFENIKSVIRKTARDNMAMLYGGRTSNGQESGSTGDVEICSEGDRYIAIYATSRSLANGVPVYSYRMTTNMIVKGKMLVASYGAMTEEPRPQIHEVVKKTAMEWNRAILRLNRD